MILVDLSYPARQINRHPGGRRRRASRWAAGGVWPLNRLLIEKGVPPNGPLTPSGGQRAGAHSAPVPMVGWIGLRCARCGLMGHRRSAARDLYRHN
jgi:hypothetical protein